MTKKCVKKVDKIGGKWDKPQIQKTTKEGEIQRKKYQQKRKTKKNYKKYDNKKITKNCDKNVIKKAIKNRSNSTAKVQRILHLSLYFSIQISTG